MVYLGDERFPVVGVGVSLRVVLLRQRGVVGLDGEQRVDVRQVVVVQVDAGAAVRLGQLRHVELRPVLTWLAARLGHWSYCGLMEY